MTNRNQQQQWQQQKKKAVGLSLAGLALVLGCACVFPHTSTSVRSASIKSKRSLTVTKIDPSSLPESEKGTYAVDACGNSAAAEGVDLGPLRYCTDAHRRSVEHCSIAENNHILRRSGDPKPLPFSVPPILSPLEIVDIESTRRTRSKCQSLEEFLSSVRNGTRQWEGGGGGRDETSPSAFMPGGCFVPAVPPEPEQVCRVLSGYSRVIVNGDSLSRHLSMALYQSIRGDYSGYPILSSSDQEIFDKCRCDGVYSEALLCRRLVDPRFEVQDLSHLCPGTDFSVEYLAAWSAKDQHLDLSGLDCSGVDDKGVLLVMGGGLHYDLDATRTYREQIEPLLTNPNLRRCVELGRARLVWIGMKAMSAQVAVKYPHQSREGSKAFNRKMACLLKSSEYGREVAILDPWELTRDAPTSDGVHGLADVNLAMAAQVIYLADKWPFPTGAEPPSPANANCS